MIIKRSFCIALAVLTALTLCACGKNGGEPAASIEPEAAAAAEPTAAPEPTRAPKPTVFHYDLDIPVYTERELLWDIDTTIDFCQYDTSDVSLDHRMDYFLAAYPTDAVRIRYDGSKYAIYDTDTGYRVYIVFDHLAGYKSNPFFARGFPLMVKEVHSYADFASIKPGDPVDRVVQIDPIARLIADSYEGKTQYQKTVHSLAEHGMPTALVHYLTDGVLKIAYDMTEDGRMIVYDIVYCEDYKLVGNTGEIIDYKLFDIDLPPQ